jgi:hypothetical protein
MTVEYGLGDDGSVAPAGCSTSFPSATSSDLTGRLRSLRVSSGSVAMGRARETSTRGRTVEGGPGGAHGHVPLGAKCGADAGNVRL